MDRVLKAARASGSLNLSNRALREAPDEVYGSLDAMGGGGEEAVELQKLILAHNEIESLRKDLKNLSMLSVLNVSNNKLGHLPDAIGEYQTIVLPEDLTHCSKLMKLEMAALAFQNSD